MRLSYVPQLENHIVQEMTYDYCVFRAIVSPNSCYASGRASTSGCRRLHAGPQCKINKCFGASEGECQYGNRQGLRNQNLPKCWWSVSGGCSNVNTHQGSMGFSVGQNDFERNSSLLAGDQGRSLCPKPQTPQPRSPCP